MPISREQYLHSLVRRGNQYLEVYGDVLKKNYSARRGIIAGPDMPSLLLEKKSVLMGPNQSIPFALYFPSNAFPLRNIPSEKKIDSLHHILQRQTSLRSRVAALIGDIERIPDEKAEVIADLIKVSGGYLAMMTFINYSPFFVQFHDGAHLLRTFLLPETPLQGYELIKVLRGMENTDLQVVTKNKMSDSLPNVLQQLAQTPAALRRAMNDVKQYQKIVLPFDGKVGIVTLPPNTQPDISDLPRAGKYIRWVDPEETDVIDKQWIILRNTNSSVIGMSSDVRLIIVTNPEDASEMPHGPSRFVDSHWIGHKEEANRNHYIIAEYPDDGTGRRIPRALTAYVYRFAQEISAE